MNDADQGADKARAHEVWLAQVQEEALEALLPICDAHHHLWLDSGHTGWPYPIEALHADTNTGHNVVHTVFLECGAEYHTDGPPHLRPVGETEFVAATAHMAELAACPNTVLKLGGFGMPMYGLRWDRQPVPPTSEELAAPWQDEVRFCIDQFGPNRCFFESNFPVDKRCCSYMVMWNTFERIASIYTAAEKRDLFHDNAARAYRVPTVA